MQLADRGTVACHHDAGDDNGHDAGGVDDVGREVAAIRDHQRREDLERSILCEAQQSQAEEPDAESDRRAAQRQLEKANAGVGR